MQPVYDVGKENDTQSPPSDKHIRVMPLILGDFRYCIRQLHGLSEVLESELPFEVMTFHRSPALVELPLQSLLLSSIKGTDSSPAGDALPAGEIAVITHLSNIAIFPASLTLPPR